MKVIKVGGAICEEPAALQKIANAWNKTNGETWLLVHGGGPQLTAALADQNLEPQRIEGLRVTSLAAAAVVANTLDCVGNNIVRKLRLAGVPAHHVSGADEVIHAVTKDKPVGLQRVGTFSSCKANSLQAGKLNVVTPVGWDADGPLNINADEAAVGLASSLGATELHFVTDVQGCLDGEGALIPHITQGELPRVLGETYIRGGMAVKLQNAQKALALGLQRILIGNLDSIATGNGTQLIKVEAPSLAAQ